MENYFSVSTTLPSEYWMGIMRDGSTNPYMYVSGQLVAGNVSSSASWWLDGGDGCGGGTFCCGQVVAICCMWR